MFGLGRSKQELEKLAELPVTYTDRAIKVGVQFPPEQHIERLAKYKRMKRLYQGKPRELYERAHALLSDTPHAKQLDTLYIAVNLADIIATKPADMLVGEPPQYETGLPDDSPEQQALNSYVEENDLTQLIYESAIGAGIRGDSFIKERFGYRQDYSTLKEIGADIPADAVMEPIIEHVSATAVFPEISAGDVKKFKAIDIAQVEYVSTPKTDIPFLNVERHLPGYIKYERYRLQEFEGGVNTQHGATIQLYNIVEKVETGRDEDLVETGVPHLLVQHIPYKAIDDHWRGRSGLDTVESLIYAINDRLTQIDYILWKHSDPNSYGPQLETGGGDAVRMGGAYIPLPSKESVVPGYMTWDGQLDGAFRELETLVGMVFQLAETPQWLFGTVLGDQNAGGTGTSHTDSGSIKARFLPILSKVARIRTQYDRAIRDALYYCQLLEKSQGTRDITPVYPQIKWQDGLPRNVVEEAEVMTLRTGGKPTLDVHSAIKRLDRVDDEAAKEIETRIKSAEETVDASIFNQQGNGGNA